MTTNDPIQERAAEQDIQFLQVIHEMKDTADHTIGVLEQLVQLALKNENDVVMNPVSVQAIATLIRYQETVITKLTEENFSQRDIAQALLDKIEALPEPGMLTERPETE